MYTPKNKNEYFEETILNTPQPQASSTVQRKTGSYTYKVKDPFKEPIKEIENFDDNRSRISSRMSSQSSLGLLSLQDEGIEDFSLHPVKEVDKKELRKSEMQMPQPTESITEKLLLQRQLAQKAIERADYITQKSVSGLPSYLLKPNFTPGRNNTSEIRNEESTVNLSDLENSSKYDKVSFEAKEISARSSSYGNTSNKIIDLTDDDNLSVYNAKCQAIFDKIRKSDIQLQQMYNHSGGTDNVERNDLQPLETITISEESSNSWGAETQDSLLSKLQNELFTPAELAADKLAADELAWHKEQDTIPIENSKEKDHLNLSCFSGYIGEGDVSSASKDEKISIGQFFQRKSNDVDALDLKESPEKKCGPIPLINITSSMCDSPRSAAPKMCDEPSKTDVSRLSIDSVMSATQIAEVLANMDTNDSPRKMIDYLMKKKKKPIKIRQSLNENLSTFNKNSVGKTFQSKLSHSKENLTDIQKTANNSVKNTQILTPSKSFNMNSVLSEINNITDTQFVSKTNSSTLKNTAKEEPKMIQIDSSDSDTKENIKTPQISKRKTRSSLLKDSSNVQEVIVINDTLDGEDNFKEIKENVLRTPEVNQTVSSITESPSISCSELEFSEDDPEVSGEIQYSTDEWIRIYSDNETHGVCVLVTYETQMSISSLSNRWLLYKVHLGQIKLEERTCTYSDNVIKVNLPEKEELLKQGREQHFFIQFVTYTYGHIELTLVIEVTDMVTKKRKEFEHILFIESEEPKVSLSTDIINFDVLPEESCKSMEFSINNCSKVPLPLRCTILQEFNIFTFGSEIPADSSNPELLAEIKLVLDSENTVSLPVNMFAPTLTELQCKSHVAELKGKLLICLEEEDSKLLQEIQLTGRVGMTKIQFRTSCLPMILVPGQTKPLYMKNSGVVKMNLEATVVDTITKQQDNIFTLDPTSIQLKPNQSTQVNVTFNPSDKLTSSVYRTLRLQQFKGPMFVCPLEGAPLCSSPKLSRISTEKSPRSSLSGRNSPRDLTKTTSPSQRSVRSSTDSGTITSGKLPIETNRTELVWGCIKPGKNQTQEFILRNRSLNRVRFHASITGAGFKIVKDQSEHVTSMSMLLHGKESRTLVINFSPSSTGAATAKLLFSPIENSEVSSVKMQVILLYGYGGHSVVDVQGVAKDPSGKMWLSFGKLDYRTVLEQSFILRNTGTLTAFAHLSLFSKASYPFINSSLRLSPNEVIIPPNKEIEISVKFTPRQEDFKFLQTSSGIEVFEVASIQMISGPEPTRGRIRKLFMKMNQTGTSTFSAELLSKLSVPFAGEHMPSDLSSCKEQEVSNSLKELLQGLTTREVNLTLEQDLEHTIALGPAVDDTCMFQSLCNDTAQLTLDHSQFDNAKRRTSGGFCTIEPTKLMLTPPVKLMDTALLCSKHSRPMPFEVMLESSELEVEPTIGAVPPGQTAVITISCKANQSKQLQFFKVMVYVENEVMEIEVKVVQVQQRRSITPSNRR